MQFRPGKSGNPGGRPRKPLAERLLNQLLANDEAEAAKVIKALLTQAKKGDVSAIKEAFDRTEGKVADKMENSGPDGGPIEITVKFV